MILPIDYGIVTNEAVSKYGSQGDPFLFSNLKVLSLQLKFIFGLLTVIRNASSVLRAMISDSNDSRVTSTSPRSFDELICGLLRAA
ncbi:hypothetical protein RB195_005289 [Necator americanus]|uniref:Uncharacterized protein n=1 Tax=Necator americanus TaxID=51031 RepID=A0ABR1BNY6_NECAM